MSTNEISDDDSIFNELEDDDDYQRLVGQRKQQMKEEYDRIMAMKASGYGQYEEIVSEKDLMTTIAKTPNIVVHFCHPQFSTCKILDFHLQNIAQEYFEVRFVRSNVENTPFLVKKLGIKVLPHLIVYKDAKLVDRLVGFDALGNSEKFETKTLVKWLEKTGILTEKIES
ncbi:hypothetical protein BB559_007453 [Furculomyces boomerangus]|uniref:Phosducin domain-containing protein n=2 Tax=Harpellales TaxID=61421 RepID=A0A2T9XXC0_9FUNG|nr:hypothetical protein BB559_007453 [Furculomyces boomerangus]PWA03415.1 hypothetical protein BB558_000417 [Smittium angustum]